MNKQSQNSKQATELENCVDENRRDLLKKALAGTTVYSIPLLTSFSMDGLNLGGEAFAQGNVGNQQPAASVPTLNIWGLGAMVAMMGGVLAWFKRRSN